MKKTTNTQNILNDYAQTYNIIKQIRDKNYLNESGTQWASVLDRIHEYEEALHFEAYNPEAKKTAGTLWELFNDLYTPGATIMSLKEYASYKGKNYTYIQKISQAIAEQVSRVIDEDMSRDEIIQMIKEAKIR